MGRLALCLLASIPVNLIACVASSNSSEQKCDVLDLEEVLANPIEYSKKVFCGDVFAVEYGRNVRVIRSAHDMPPSSDLALLVSSRSRGLLEGISHTPKKFYVKAQIDPMTICFKPSQSGEECSPYRRPIVFHIFSAQRPPK